LPQDPYGRMLDPVEYVGSNIGLWYELPACVGGVLSVIVLQISRSFDSAAPLHLQVSTIARNSTFDFFDEGAEDSKEK
jgi:hypothetical protein